MTSIKKCKDRINTKSQIIGDEDHISNTLCVVGITLLLLFVKKTEKCLNKEQHFQRILFQLKFNAIFDMGIEKEIHSFPALM